MKTFKTWAQVPERLFLQDGTKEGLVTVESIAGFYVGQMVVIKSASRPSKTCQIKRFASTTQFIVGPQDNNPQRHTSIDLYLTADNATVYAPEQQVLTIHDNGEIQASVYEEQPLAALRTLQIDNEGQPYSTTNPLPVQLSDGSVSIGTVNAELEVQLTHLDNSPDPGDIADSVRVGDGVNELSVNSDGSINVNISGTSNKELLNIYDTLSDVATGADEILVDFNIPDDGGTYFLSRVEFSGENIAKYQLRINGNPIATRRTYFGANLTDSFEFFTATIDGIELEPEDEVKIIVRHDRPYPADFEGRIQITKIA